MGTEIEESEGRRKRSLQIQIASGSVILLWVVFAIILICTLTNLKENQHWISICILISASILSMAIIIKNTIIFFIANDNIFPYSGMPVQMLNKLYEALLLSSQAILAVIFVTIIAVLIAERIVESQAGLPIISAIIGYTVAKDVSNDKVAYYDGKSVQK